MRYEVITGTASRVNQDSDSTYIASAISDTPQAVNFRVFSFRLGERAVFYRTQQFPQLSQGDRVSVVGTLKRGVFQAVGLRNHTIGAAYYPPTGGATFVAWIIIIFGIPAIGLLGLGFLMIGLGIHMLMQINSKAKAYKLLEQAT